MAKVYLDRAWMGTATTGTGTITLGSAQSGYMTFADAGIANADTISYVILDGNDFEMGTGTYTSAGTTMSRDTVLKSSVGGTVGTTKLNLSGSATVFVTHLSREIAITDKENTFTAGQTLKSTDAGASRGPTLTLLRDSASPAQYDELGEVKFQGRDGAGNLVDYASIVAWINDTTNGSEDGGVDIKAINAGSEKTVISFYGDTYTYIAGTGTGATPYWDFYNTTAGTSCAHIVLNKSRSSGVVTAYDSTGAIDFYGHDGSAYLAAGQLSCYVDGTPGANDMPGAIQLCVTPDGAAGTLTNMIRLYNNGTAVNRLNAGACEGTLAPTFFCHLTADYTLSNVATEQKAFNHTANGALTLPTGVYEFEALLYLTSMSATSGNYAFDPVGAGTATTDRWLQQSIGIDSTSPLNGNTMTGTASVTQQTPASSVSAGTGTGSIAKHRGVFRISAGGTIIPSVTLVTAAAAVMKAGSWFIIRRIADSSATYVGPWS